MNVTLFVFFSLITVIVIITTLILEYYLKLSNFWFYLSYFFANLPLAFGAANFVAITLLIFTRFKYINNLFKLMENGGTANGAGGVFFIENVPNVRYDEIYDVYSSKLLRNEKDTIQQNILGQFDFRPGLKKVFDYFTKNKVWWLCFNHLMLLFLILIFGLIFPGFFKKLCVR